MKTFDGTKWNSEGKATPTKDGLMPKEDKATLDGASTFGKGFLTKADAQAARDELGLSAGATTPAGTSSELNSGNQTNSRVWSPKNIADYVKAGNTANLNEAKNYTDSAKTVVNVKDFGAVGDGITNDTSSIQAAIDYVGSKGGGEVFVPKSSGPYMIGRLYVTEDNLIFRSEPGVIFKRKGYTFGIINLTNINGTNTIEIKDTTDGYSGPSNISIIGGIWDCNFINESYPPGGYNIFYFSYCRNIKFEDITVLDLVTNHALDMNAVSNLRVTNCKFLGYKDGTVDQSRGAVEAIQLTAGSEDTLAGSSAVMGHPCEDVVVSNCEFGDSNTPGTGPWPTAVGNHGATPPPVGFKLNNNIIIQNCTIKSATLAGIYLYTWEQTKVIGNTLKDCVVGIQAGNMTSTRRWNRETKVWDIGPSRVECGNHQIHNNYLEDCAIGINLRGTGVGADGIWKPMVNLSVRGNTLKNTKIDSTSGIRFLICKNSTAEGNIVEGYLNAFVFESCQDILITNNKSNSPRNRGYFINNSNTPAGDVFTAQRIDVLNNVVTDSGTHGINIDAVSSIRLIGNSIINWGRTSGSSAIILFSSIKKLIVSANSMNMISNINNTTGIRFDLGTFESTYMTKDNYIAGSTNTVYGYPASGVIYGPIEYI